MLLYLIRSFNFSKTKFQKINWYQRYPFWFIWDANLIKWENDVCVCVKLHKCTDIYSILYTYISINLTLLSPTKNLISVCHIYFVPLWNCSFFSSCNVWTRFHVDSISLLYTHRYIYISWYICIYSFCHNRILVSLFLFLCHLFVILFHNRTWRHGPICPRTVMHVRACSVLHQSPCDLLSEYKSSQTTKSISYMNFFS